MQRTAALSLCTLLASCVEKMGPVPPVPGFDTAAMQADLQAHAADLRRMERDCPWPDQSDRTHAAIATRPLHAAPGLPRSWTDGCAVIRFLVGPDGKMTDAEIASEYPAAAGRAALAVVEQSTSASGAIPGSRFTMRIGLYHDSAGNGSITTVVR